VVCEEWSELTFRQFMLKVVVFVCSQQFALSLNRHFPAGMHCLQEKWAIERQMPIPLLQNQKITLKLFFTPECVPSGLQAIADSF
jgi:hypothetical protein